MGGPLEGFGQAGANDGQVAVFFDHHNGLILPDFSGGSDGISEMDGFHQIYLLGVFIVGAPSNQPHTCLRASLSNSFVTFHLYIQPLLFTIFLISTRALAMTIKSFPSTFGP